MPSTLTPGLLADELIGVADVVRSSVHGALGTRPYTVHTVLRTWSGSRPGDGTVFDVETEIVPPPSIPQLGANQMRPTGQDEEGTITATEVSLTYSEDDICRRNLAANEQFYWRLTERHGQNSAPQWFVVAARPKAQRGDQEGDTIGWVIRLRRVEDPR
jgi:hypothetical protein